MIYLRFTLAAKKPVRITCAALSRSELFATARMRSAWWFL